MSVFPLNSVLTDDSVQTGEIVLIEGIPRHRGAFSQFFFMTKTKKGFAPLLVGGSIPTFESEEKATEWIRA